MSEGAGRLWLTVAALATAATAAVAVPGAALLADARRPAFLAGCGVALAAALAGAIPLALEAVRPGRDAIVAVGKAALEAIDAAYRAKYRRYAASIVDSTVTTAARSATLKLVPHPPAG